MASIPIYQEQVQTPSGRGAVTARADTSPHFLSSAWATEGGNQLVRGVGVLETAMVARQQEEARAWAIGAMSEARLKWTEKLLERQAAAEPNAPGFTPSVLSDFDEYASKTLENAPNNAARRYMTDRLGQLRTHIGERSMVFEAQARIDYRDDQFKKGADNGAKLMNTDPSQYGEVLAEQLAVIDSSNVPPVQKSAMRERTINRISEAAVWSQIQKSPSKFLGSIGFGVPADGKVRKSSGDLTGQTGNLAFDALPFERRVVLFNQAIQQKAQIDADANQATVANAKVVAETAMKDAWDKVYTTGLKETDLQRLKPIVGENDYRALREAVKRGQGEATVKNDRGAVAQLMLLQSQGKWEEAEKFVHQAYKSRLLNDETFRSEVGRIRTSGRQEGPKSEYERTRDLITQSLAPSPMIADPIPRLRYGEAIDSYNRWIKDNPKATDADIEKRGREIIDQFAIVDMKDAALALPHPRSGAIPRGGDRATMAGAISRATAEARKRLANGTYTQAEFNSEMVIINRWTKVVPPLPPKATPK